MRWTRSSPKAKLARCFCARYVVVVVGVIVVVVVVAAAVSRSCYFCVVIKHPDICISLTLLTQNVVD